MWMTSDGQYKVTQVHVTGGKKLNLYKWKDTLGKSGDWSPVIQVGSVTALSKYIDLSTLVTVTIPDEPPTEGQPA